MQSLVLCMSWDSEHNMRQWEINIDSKVWPCCIFVTQVYPYMQPELMNTPEFMELYAKDPDWNNLQKHTLEEIQSHTFYTEIVHPKGWNSNNPPNICKMLCNKNKVDTTKNTAGHIEENR